MASLALHHQNAHPLNVQKSHLPRVLNVPLPQTLCKKHVYPRKEATEVGFNLAMVTVLSLSRRLSYRCQGLHIFDTIGQVFINLFINLFIFLFLSVLSFGLYLYLYLYLFLSFCFFADYLVSSQSSEDGD